MALPKVKPDTTASKAKAVGGKAKKNPPIKTAGGKGTGGKANGSGC